jgi:hypothetical protein
VVYSPSAELEVVRSNSVRWFALKKMFHLNWFTGAIPTYLVLFQVVDSPIEYYYRTMHNQINERYLPTYVSM